MKPGAYHPATSRLQLCQRQVSSFCLPPSRGCRKTTESKIEIQCDGQEGVLHRCLSRKDLWFQLLESHPQQLSAVSPAGSASAAALHSHPKTDRGMGMKTGLFGPLPDNSNGPSSPASLPFLPQVLILKAFPNQQ